MTNNRLRHGLSKMGTYYHYRIRWEGADIKGSTRCTTLKDAIAWMEYNKLEYLRPQDVLGGLQTIRTLENKKYAKNTDSCEVCGWRMPITHPEISPRSSPIHVHHIIRVADGGTGAPENLIALCPNHHAMAHRLVRFHEITAKSSLIAVLSTISGIEQKCINF